MLHNSHGNQTTTDGSNTGGRESMDRQCPGAGPAVAVSGTDGNLEGGPTVLSDALKEITRLRAELQQAAKERDLYRDALHGKLHQEWQDLSEEDFAEAVPTGPWFDEVISQLDKGDAR